LKGSGGVCELAAGDGGVHVGVAGAFEEALDGDGAAVEVGADLRRGVGRARAVGFPEDRGEVAAVEDPFAQRVTEAAAFVVEQGDDARGGVGGVAADEDVLGPRVAVEDAGLGDEIEGGGAAFGDGGPGASFGMRHGEVLAVGEESADVAQDKIAPAGVRCRGGGPAEVGSGGGVNAAEERGELAPESVVVGGRERGHHGVPVFAFDEFAEDGVARADRVGEIRSEGAGDKFGDGGEPRGEAVFAAEQVVFDVKDQRVGGRRGKAQDRAASVGGGEAEGVVEGAAAEFDGFGDHGVGAEQARGEGGELRGGGWLLEIGRGAGDQLKHGSGGCDGGMVAGGQDPEFERCKSGGESMIVICRADWRRSARFPGEKEGRERFNRKGICADKEGNPVTP
jgi:hypothetical protein